jgi:hypothetical protein
MGEVAHRELEGCCRGGFHSCNLRTSSYRVHALCRVNCFANVKFLPDEGRNKETHHSVLHSTLEGVLFMQHRDSRHSLQAWRDAYTLACLLCASAHLSSTHNTPSSLPSNAAGLCTTNATPQRNATEATSAAIRDLDLAVMMGGPRCAFLLSEVVSTLHDMPRAQGFRALPCHKQHLHKFPSDTVGSFWTELQHPRECCIQ